ncbi:NAD(P)-dependent oxidoreductase [Microbacterium sp. NPDC058389]|uniref:NAD(P)-dependent oxidoreductase n=1 Tax=Microbacterium sp. NPDC058389 TaxID=3346475 RepID=UPI00364F476A
MKIVVLGATGNVGSRFTTQAVKAGHQVVAFARTPEAVQSQPGVTTAQGAAEDTAALTAAARGADALLVSITGPMKDGDFMQRNLPKIIEAAKAAGVDRVVLVSAFGAGDTAQKASGFARLIYRTALRRFFADKAAADQLLQASGLDWTIVYPINLKDAPALPETAVEPLAGVGRVPGLPTLPFDNVAAALVGIITDPTTTRQRLLITTPRGWRPSR